MNILKKKEKTRKRSPKVEKPETIIEKIEKDLIEV